MIGSSKSIWGFDPRSVPGCSLWLDAADSNTITLSGSNVTQWNDKSGSSNHFTPTSGTPTSILDNGRSVVNFTSGTIMRSTNQITFTTSSAFFIVSRLNSITAANTGMLLDFTYMNGYKSIRFYGPNGILGGTPATFGDEYELANGAYYVNGTFNPSFGSSTYLNTYSIIGTVAPSSGGTTYLAFSSSFYERYFIGNIAEFLYYPGGVTSTQRQQVEGYLAHKWGIGSIPSTHPFYSVRPHLRGFQPTDIDGCQLWLDAADSATISPSTGGTLTSWTDKSGTGKTITINSAPSYSTTGFNSNYPSMTFTSGNNLRITIPSVGTGDIAIFAVWRQTTANTQHNVFSIGTPGGGTETALGWNNGEGRYKFYRYAGPESVNNAATNNANVIGSALQVSGLRTLHINGVAPSGTGTESYNQTNTTAFIGGGTFPLVGQLAELIFYIGTVTTTQRQQVEGYLAHKWGLTTPIPSTHPFKSITPASLPFSPRNISGVALWLDAADQSSMTLSGSNVTQWNDKSGNGRNATTPAGTVSPPYLSATREVQFVETNSNVLRIAQGFGDALVGTTHSIFFIGRRTVASGYHFFLASTANAGGNVLLMIGFRDNNMSTNTYGPEFNSSISTYSSPDPVRLYCFEVQSSSLATHILNGTQIGSSSQNFILNSFANPELGRRYGTTPNHTFNLSEMIAFSPALTTSQRQKVEGYLAHKWGLAESLPSTHPFKKFPA